MTEWLMKSEWMQSGKFWMNERITEAVNEMKAEVEWAINQAN